MVDLREECIEAGVEEILRWGIKPEKLPAGERHLAGLFFDRLLSVLTEHADEWADFDPLAHPMVRALKARTARRLLAVLTEEDV